MSETPKIRRGSVQAAQLLVQLRDLESRGLKESAAYKAIKEALETEER